MKRLVGELLLLSGMSVAGAAVLVDDFEQGSPSHCQPGAP